MKKYIYILAAAAAFVGCAKEVTPTEEIQNQKPETGVKTVTFTASIEGETKGTLDSKGKFTWIEDSDEVAVWTNLGKKTAVAKNVSGGSAEFTFTLGEGESIAQGAILVYPAFRLSDTNKNEVSLLPEVTNTPEESHGPILAAKVGTDRTTLNFKYVCGTVQATITGIPSFADRIWILFTGGSPGAENTSISFNDETPVVASGSGDNITGYLPSGFSGGNQTITLPVPGTGSRSFYFAIRDDNVELFYKNMSNKSLTFARNSYFKMANWDLPVYTIAGAKLGDDSEAGIFGTPWAPSNSDNDMTCIDANIYKKVYKNVTISAGADGKLSIAYKIAKNHSWAESYGYGEGNFTFTSSEYKTSITGDVEITFNSSSHESTCSFVIANDVYFVYGDFCGAWEYSAANELVDNGSGVYTKDFTIDEAKTVNFKIVKNHTFATSWPSSNFVYNVLKPGSFTVTFSPSTEHVYAWDSSTYAVAGTPAAIFDASWDTTAKQLTRQTDGTFKVEIPVSVTNDTSIQFKVVANGNWATAYPSANVSETIHSSNSLLTITYSPYDQSVNYSIN